MTVFSTWAIEHFAAGSINWTGQEIGVALLTRAPADPLPTAPQGIDALVDALGYSEQFDANYSRVTAQVTSSPSGTTTRIILGEDFDLPDNVAPAFVASAAFFLADVTIDGVFEPWLFISEITFNQIVYEGSTLTTRTTHPRVLFSYTPRGTSVDVAIGGLVRSPGETVWEPPRVQHVFLYPERVNYALNPSFEDVGLFGWRARTGITRVVGGVDHPANHYAAVLGNRLESLPMAQGSGLYRVSGYFRSKGATQIWLGLTVWADDWLVPGDIVELPQPLSTGWSRIDRLVAAADGLAGVGVLVLSDGAFDADLILLENTVELHNYFDGNSTTSVIGDFSWQGVSHRSFSFWYNNKNLVGARLFGEYQEGPVTKEGLVYDWMPEGTAIYTHWDVLSPNDTRQPFQDWGSRLIP